MPFSAKQQLSWNYQVLRILENLGHGGKYLGFCYGIDHWHYMFSLGRFLGPVHTNPFSNENGAVLLRIRLSSTLQRRKRSPKTEPFENVLQSGAIWKRCISKRCFLVRTEKTMLSENGDVIKIHDRAPDHSTVSIQNGGQTLPCGFNFAPISRTEILKCACVGFIWACPLRV